MNNYPNHIQDLFYKVLSGEATDVEVNNLKNEMDKDNRLKSLFEDYSTTTNQIRNLKLPYSIDFENSVMSAIGSGLKVVYKKSENIFSKYLSKGPFFNFIFDRGIMGPKIFFKHQTNIGRGGQVIIVQWPKRGHVRVILNQFLI